MKVSDLVRELNLTVFCGEAGLDAEISGGYTSDLLSDVMECCGSRCRHTRTSWRSPL